MADPHPATRPGGVPSRALRLLDIMALVAAVAIGFAISRASWMPVLFSPGSPLSHRLLGIYWLIVPYVLCLTAAVLLIQLRRPRPPFAELVSRPGMAACVAASAVIAVRLAWASAADFWGTPGRMHVEIHTPGVFAWSMVDRAPWVTFVGGLGDRTGCAVMGVWLVLLLSRRWRAEPTWADRAGRAVGGCWLVLMAMSWGLSFRLFWTPYYF